MNDSTWAESKHLLQTLNQAISEAPDLETALTMVLGEVCKFTNSDYGEAWFPAKNGTVLELSPAWYKNTCRNSDYLPALDQFRLCSEAFIFPLGIGLPGRVWSSQQPEWICDASAHSETYFLRNQVAKAFGIKAGFGVPIIARNNVLAVLVFFMCEAREEDRQMVELVAAAITPLSEFLQRSLV